jgi:hypothetical protein
MNQHLYVFAVVLSVIAGSACGTKSSYAERSGVEAKAQSQALMAAAGAPAPELTGNPFHSPHWAGPTETPDWAGPTETTDWAGPTETTDWAGPTETTDWAGPTEATD